MPIELKLGDEAYALYKEDTNEYVYLGGGNGVFGFKRYPKPTGMAPTAEKAQKKKDNLIARIEEYAADGQPWHETMTHEEAWEKAPGNFRDHTSYDDFVKIRERNIAWEKERWSQELEIVKSFIIVKIGVEKV
jgi:hypothetical protein